jgi:hypothetical protein
LNQLSNGLFCVQNRASAKRYNDLIMLSPICTSKF